jgi:inhibitor of cysteine peptidase
LWRHADQDSGAHGGGGLIVAHLTVTRADNGRVVAANVGDTIAVRLDENPTTGYTWSIASIDGARLEAGSPTREPGARVGAGGTTTWPIQARAAGRARLELVHARSWAGEASAAERFAVTFDITG